MTKYRPGDLLKILAVDIYPEEHVLVLSVKKNWYSVYRIESNKYDLFECEWVDSRIYIKLVK